MTTYTPAQIEKTGLLAALAKFPAEYPLYAAEIDGWITSLKTTPPPPAPPIIVVGD